MATLSIMARWEGVLIILLMAVAVVVQLLTGQIRTAGIFDNKRTGALDPGRAQLLVVTLAMCLQVLMRLGEPGVHRVVGLPSNWPLTLFGGSHALYLVRKWQQSRVNRKGG